MKEQITEKSLYSIVKNNYTQHKYVKPQTKPQHDEFNIFKCLCL